MLNSGVADASVRPPAHRVPTRAVAWPAATLISIMALAALMWWTAPVPIMAPWDVFILLDGGYRIIQGQVPGADFTSGIGPLVYGMVSLGMRFQDVPSLTAIPYGNLIFLAASSALAWTVSRRRLPSMYAAGFTVLIAFLTVAVRPLGYPVWVTTYAMLYNRYGWVLYTILLVLVLIRPRITSRRSLSVDGVVLGLLLGWLFYCKANFFLVGVMAVGVGLAMRTVERRWSLAFWAAVGISVSVATMRFGFGVSISGYVDDIVAAGAAQNQQRLMSLARAIFYGLPMGLTALLVVGALAVVVRRRGQPTDGFRTLSLAIVAVLGSTVVVAAANTPERYELPAYVVVALLVAAHIDKASSLPRRPALIGIWALLIVSIAPILVKDSVALANGVAARAPAAPVASQELESERLRDFVVPAHSNWATAYRAASDVPPMLNDGMALLRRHVASADTVFVVALTDPFSFALSLPPIRGAPLWWDLDVSFSRNSHPGPEFLGDVRWVMIPRIDRGQGCCHESVRAMLELYGPYLDRHFVEVERTREWALLARAR